MRCWHEWPLGRGKISASQILHLIADHLSKRISSNLLYCNLNVSVYCSNNGITAIKCHCREKLDWNRRECSHESLSGGPSPTTHQNPTRLTWMGALIHGNLWKDKSEKWQRHTKAAGNSHTRTGSALFNRLTARCWKGADFVSLFSLMGAPAFVFKRAKCLPSEKPSFPGGSLKMEG